MTFGNIVKHLLIYLTFTGENGLPHNDKSFYAFLIDLTQISMYLRNGF